MAKLLVVVGAIDDEEHVKHVVRTVDTGIDNWLRPFPLHTQEEIRSILNSLRSMKSIPNRNADSGSVVSRFKGRILDTTILINPTLKSLHDEIVDLLITASPDCLVVYGGFVSEGEADWILQDGLFTLEHLLHNLSDSKVLSSISNQKVKLAVSCRKIRRWRNTEMSRTHENIHLEIIDSGQRDQDGGSPAKSAAAENNLDSFTSFLEENISNEIHTVFNTLTPPSRQGFIKTRNPCLYIFPGGYGDSAFFAINGFNMLVNGGSTSKPCFWKVVKHMERVDSILATHLGTDNLPGINSFLMRKLQEQQIKLPIDSTSEEYKELRRCLISPHLGPMFINAPLQYLESLSKTSPKKGVEEAEGSATPNGSHDQLIFKASDVIKETIRLSKALDLKMTPLHRKSTLHEPITLFSKWGCGKLDMYVLNPVEGSKELNYMNEKWGVAGHCKIPVGKSGVLDEDGQEGTTTYADLCSIAVLLVWHPSDPNEKIVRVLFPGNTSQSKIFDGLDRISDLPFMKVQHATESIVRAMKEVPKVNGASSSQKPPRAASAPVKSTGTVHKKFVPSIGKKAGGSSNSLTKESASSHSKISDRRAKNEKPAMTKTKGAMAATGKSATLKDKPIAAKSSKGTGGQVSTRPTPVSSTTKRPAAPSSKVDTKRPASKTATTKVKSAEKTTEKSKKPAAAVQKAKADAAKLTTKKSPRQGMKKTTSKPMSNKGTKGTKESPQKSPSSRQTDSLIDVSQSLAKPDMTPNSGNSNDVGMDEPNETVLSERRSPDGGDGSSVQCAFGVASGNSEVQSMGDGEVKSDADCDNLQLVMNKLCISEESDMISTDGASAVSTQPTPIGDAVSIPDVAKFEEYISSDKSTPDEEQGGGDNGGKVLPDTLTSDKESSEMAVELMDQPVIHGHEASDETANGPGIKVEDAVVSQNVMTIDATAIATLQDDDNCSIEAVEQKEFQSNDLAGNIEVNNQLVDCSSVQLTQVTGSDIPSSSSVEGSYELCSTGKSPLLASTQETIAETISDFKLDEPVATEAEEEPTVDLQLHHTEAVEEHTISDAFDAHDDISGGFTASVVARVDPPFSSSDASHSTKDLAPGQDLAQDIAIVQEDGDQYETEVEKTKEFENLALTEHSEDHCKAQEDVVMSNTEEDCDDQMTGDRESDMPAVVDSVPWNKPEGQHQDNNWQQGDPAESSNDTMHLGGTEVEVSKMISLSEKELHHQDEKDDVSVNEFTENSDVDDAGNTSEKQLHFDGGENEDSAPILAECSGADDAVDASEKGFLEDNEKGPVSIPEAFEYSGRNDVIDAPDKLFLETDEKESVSIPKTSEYYRAGDVAGQPREYTNQNEEESDSVPVIFDYSSTSDAENALEKEFLDQIEQKPASVRDTSEYFGAEPPMELPDQIEKKSVSIPETFDYSGTCDAQNVLEKEFPDQSEQEYPSLPDISEYSDEEHTDELSQELIHRSEEGFVSATNAHSEYDAKEISQGCEEDGNLPQHVIEDSNHFDETNDQDSHSGNMQDNAESQGSQLPSTDNLVKDNELHAAHASATDGNVAKDSCDSQKNDHVDEEPQSNALNSEEEIAIVTAKLFAMMSEDDPLDAELLTHIKAYQGGYDVEKAEEQKMPVDEEAEASRYGLDKTTFRYLNQFVSDEPEPADTSTVDQPSVCPISVSTDAKVLDVNIDQGEAKKFDSPLNASAVPFIPATMQTDQLKPNDEQLGDEQRVADSMHGVAAATPPHSTNPFLLDMLADCPSTQIEPEELFLPPTRDQDPCAGQDKFGKATTKKSSQARKLASSHVYVDLAYIPNHGDKASIGLEFFKKIRARYYVITGSQLTKDQSTIDVLNYLLQGRKSWLSEPGKNAGQEDCSVTVLPTHDTPSLQEWFNQNFKDLEKYNVHLVASGSQVVMQDEIIDACKIEF